MAAILPRRPFRFPDTVHGFLLDHLFHIFGRSGCL